MRPRALWPRTPMKFIVKYFPEITIKSKPVRQQLTRLLRDNLHATLRPLHPDVKVVARWDYLTATFLEGTTEQTDAARQVLASTPGIAWFARVVDVPLGDLDDVLEKTLALWRERLAGQTFAVRCKRAGQHDFSSMDVERHVGGGLLHRSEARGVRLKDPDLTVELVIRHDRLLLVGQEEPDGDGCMPRLGKARGVRLNAPALTVELEIRHARLLLVDQKEPGIGGFPVGGSEPVLSLISGGFDSTVASYLTMRRGMPTHFCFFNLGGRDHELGVKNVAHYLWHRHGGGRRVQFVTVPFEAVVAEILGSVRDSQMGVILKRMMLRAASRIAARLELPALVTGESVAQVSSQTVTNLAVIDEACDMLVLRPLATHHKSEIIAIAEAIGTATFAAHMPEYCGVISVRPTTRARRERIAAEEEQFDFEVLEQAIAAAVVEPIDGLSLSAESEEAMAVETLAAPLPGSEIIDIRPPAQAAQRPLRTGTVAVRNIPFYELQQRAAELDRQGSYLLYCDQGMMSRLHASHLLGQGYTRVRVYRPA